MVSAAWWDTDGEPGFSLFEFMDKQEEEARITLTVTELETSV